MEIYIKRIARKKGYTIGRLYKKDERENNKQQPLLTYFCDTLEPEWRDIGWGRPGKKVKGKTAVPEGRYPVVVTYSRKMRKWLPLLVGVPQFEGIRIHAGNTAKDTKGCILLGENKQKGMVLNSRATLQRLMQMLDARKDGEPCFITIE